MVMLQVPQDIGIQRDLFNADYGLICEGILNIHLLLLLLCWWDVLVRDAALKAHHKDGLWTYGFAMATTLHAPCPAKPAGLSGMQRDLLFWVSFLGTQSFTK